MNRFFDPPDPYLRPDLYTQDVWTPGPDSQLGPTRTRTTVRPYAGGNTPSATGTWPSTPEVWGENISDAASGGLSGMGAAVYDNLEQSDEAVEKWYRELGGGVRRAYDTLWLGINAPPYRPIGGFPQKQVSGYNPRASFAPASMGQPTGQPARQMTDWAAKSPYKPTVSQGMPGAKDPTVAAKNAVVRDPNDTRGLTPAQIDEQLNQELWRGVPGGAPRKAKPPAPGMLGAADKKRDRTEGEMATAFSEWMRQPTTRKTGIFEKVKGVSKERLVDTTNADKWKGNKALAARAWLNENEKNMSPGEVAKVKQAIKEENNIQLALNTREGREAIQTPIQPDPTTGQITLENVFEKAWKIAAIATGHSKMGTTHSPDSHIRIKGVPGWVKRKDVQREAQRDLVNARAMQLVEMWMPALQQRISAQGNIDVAQIGRLGGNEQQEIAGQYGLLGTQEKSNADIHGYNVGGAAQLGAADITGKYGVEEAGVTAGGRTKAAEATAAAARQKLAAEQRNRDRNYALSARGPDYLKHAQRAAVAFNGLLGKNPQIAPYWEALGNRPGQQKSIMDRFLFFTMANDDMTEDDVETWWKNAVGSNKG